MKLGIVGRPKSGKTTLFNLLTRSHQSVDKFGAVRETHVGTAHVPDPRLDRLSAMFKPKKHTPATVDFVDVPGIAKGEQEKIAHALSHDMVTNFPQAFGEVQEPPWRMALTVKQEPWPVVPGRGTPRESARTG